MEDHFLTQHVDFPTRGDNILDMVITDDPDDVRDLTDLGQFVPSDHKAFIFGFRTDAELPCDHLLYRDYRKADVKSFKMRLTEKC